MGKVTVNFYGPLAARAGISAQPCEVDLPAPAALRRVFEILAGEYGGRLLDVVIDPTSGQLQQYLNILINGEPVQRLHGLETPLKQGDRVTIRIDVLSGIGGGSIGPMMPGGCRPPLSGGVRWQS